MNQLKKKLNSNRGSSMILALALCLLCLMVSSVIMVAATSGTSRNVDRVQKQRAYLAVSSAAQLIAEELEQVRTIAANQQRVSYDCIAYEERIEWENGEGVFISGYSVPNSVFNVNNAFNPTIIDRVNAPIITTVVDEDSLTGLFAGMIATATQTIYTNNTPYREEITISSSEERLPDVTCVFNMDTSYNIEIVLKTNDSDYALRVEMAAAAISSQGWTEVGEENHTHVVYYRVAQAGRYVDAIGELICKGDIEESVQTITWNSPVIIKGGVSE